MCRVLLADRLERYGLQASGLVAYRLLPQIGNTLELQYNFSFRLDEIGSGYSRLTGFRAARVDVRDNYTW